MKIGKQINFTAEGAEKTEKKIYEKYGLLA